MNIWYVKGDDEGLMREKVSSLVAELSGGDSFAVEDFDDDDYTVAQLLDACLTPPFLGDRRVVVARRIGRFRTDELEPLLSWLDNPLPTTALVLTAGGGEVSRKVTPAVKKAGTVVDTSPGQGKARSAWISERLKDAPVRLDRHAADLLSEHLGEDVARLPGVLDVLAATYGEGAAVGVADLEPFLGEAGGTAPWDLTDSIDRGETEAALTHLHRLMGGGGRHALVVMATIHRHFGGMLRLDGAGVHDENEAAAVLGVKPFPAKKVLQQSQRLGHAKVAQAITWIAQADLELRGFHKDWPAPLVMEVLVARLCTLNRARARAGAAARGRR